MAIIFDNLKQHRFVIVDPRLYDFDHHLVILSDLEFWHNRWEDLEKWCEDHGCDIAGMTVDFPNEQALTMFCLKWS